ncbi:MAG: HesA/MoeB/ThiF family protein [Litorivicinaceae bacterium]
MNEQQLLRYSRQLLLSDIGVEGQARMLAGHVLVIGVGGLGSAVALYLASAGVGRLTLCDGDHVDLSNLQRQVLHRESRLGMNKAASAREELATINPDCHVTAMTTFADDAHLDEWVKVASVVVDASDNFDTRQAVNRACVRWRKPLVSGAAIAWVGQLSVFDVRQPDSPCYACFMSEQTETPTQTCSDTGVLGPLTGTIGSMQATEVIRLLCHERSALVGRVLLYDALHVGWQDLVIQKNPSCAVCQEG